MTKVRYAERSLSVSCYRRLQVHFLISSLLWVMIYSGVAHSVAADEAATSDEISVLAVGDITVSSRMTPVIERKGAGLFFQGTAALIQSADVATASLNTSISERGELRYGIDNPFRSAPGLGRAIANAGFDAVSLATPNMMDFGLEALVDTIAELERYNVKPIGAGANTETAKLPAYVPVPVSTGSVHVGLLGYYRVNAFIAYTEDPLAYAVYSEMVAAVKQTRSKAALVIVWLHWGSQGRAADDGIGRQQIFAHTLINAGADMVLCQQMHTFGGIELYQGKPIVYSLADFIYDTYDKQHSHIVIPKATFASGILKSIELIPILTDPPKIPVRPGKPTETPAASEIGADRFPSLLTGEQAIKTLQDYQRRCAKFETEVIIEGERGWIR
ncbi:MAG: CapA family protein [Candidatus Poribacteria bacterium]|nr:CapA family protein [Candidatus Poribacteria bacterium]